MKRTACLIMALGIALAGCDYGSRDRVENERIKHNLEQSQSVVPVPAVTVTTTVTETVEAPVIPEPVSEPETISAAPEVPAPASTPEPVQDAPAATSTYGCDAAVAYLQEHAHPAFRIVCPGYAFGGQAVTCLNHAPQCPNDAVIIINVPCEIAYMNEAANSWTLYNSTGAAIDPYGSRC